MNSRVAPQPMPDSCLLFSSASKLHLWVQASPKRAQEVVEYLQKRKPPSVGTRNVPKRAEQQELVEGTEKKRNHWIYMGLSNAFVQQYRELRTLFTWICVIHYRGKSLCTSCEWLCVDQKLKIVWSKTITLMSDYSSAPVIEQFYTIDKFQSTCLLKARYLMDNINH